MWESEGERQFGVLHVKMLTTCRCVLKSHHNKNNNKNKNNNNIYSYVNVVHVISFWPKTQELYNAANAILLFALYQIYHINDFGIMYSSAEDSPIFVRLHHLNPFKHLHVIATVTFVIVVIVVVAATVRSTCLVIPCLKIWTIKTVVLYFIREILGFTISDERYEIKVIYDRKSIKIVVAKRV